MMAEFAAEFAAFVREGEMLGYKGDVLGTYVKERQREARDERAARCEAEKIEREWKERERERQEKEKEREEREKDRQVKVKER